MKAVLFATNILLLSIILFQACNSGGREMKTAATAQIVVPHDCQVPCKDYSAIPLPGTVDGDFVKQMSEAYAADKNKSYITGVQTVPGTPARDALSICFNIEQIKNLIWRMENEACKANCNSRNLKLGIRFYYIKYSLKDTANLPPDLSTIIRKNANKHSVVMVPAIWRGGEYYDFDLNSGSQNCFSQPVIIGQSYKVLAGIIPDGGDNHGGLGPPPDPGTYPTNQ